ncbi:hypothetical protein OGAPHI_001822 [Ogataea philodendri]|uniref:Uncharacterized protein n=1 Tax=Ogataea philodendri TaxID=1378263 RepID=A0A9P8P9I1_9ASCO|nr:uncharacterized protein OGAPHI_001822 [Ogataea philodendri]KAH3668068.1 hypothetical protein OGAPHI_001822 [Ogataea philodendri]
MTPLMTLESSREPPSLPSTRINSKSTSLRSRSATFKTVSTAIRANWSWHLDTIFEPNDVLAALNSSLLTLVLLSKFSVSIATSSAILSSCSMAILQALSKPCAILIGWIPFSMSSSAWSNRAPVSTTTPVVPSPISSSCDLESSTNSLAISLFSSICDMMVAPSLVMLISPSGEMRILSSPRGPRDVFRIEATCLAAKICDLTASVPCVLFLDPWSLTIINGRPISSCATMALDMSGNSIDWGI